MSDIQGNRVIGSQGSPIAAQAPQDGQVLTWDATAQRYVPKPGGGGGAALTVTDGTHSVANTGTISFSGATVSGSSPIADVAVSGGGAAAIVSISNGTVSPGAAHFDITLPTVGYSYLKLSVIGLVLTSGLGSDELSGAFSYDAGATWLNDNVNADSYNYYNGSRGSASLLPLDGGNSAIYAADKTATGLTAHFDIYNSAPTPWINPIAETWFSGSAQIDDQVTGLIPGDPAAVNPAATVAPPAGAPNKLRLQPKSDGSVSQTSVTFAGGVWILAGVPS